MEVQVFLAALLRAEEGFRNHDSRAFLERKINDR